MRSAKRAAIYGISWSFKEIESEYDIQRDRDENDLFYSLSMTVTLPNPRLVEDAEKYYNLIKRLEDIADSDVDCLRTYISIETLNYYLEPVLIYAEEDSYGLMYLRDYSTDFCYIGKKENGAIKPLSEIMPYVGMREGAINLTKLGTANTVKDETKSKLNSKYYYWHTKDAGGPSLTFRYYAEVTVRNGTVQNVSLKPENKNFKYSSSSSSSSSSGSSSSYYHTPNKKDDEETTTKKFSNPYNVQDFGDPEDFYDYWYDDFEDYEEAYDYYYDHYPY